VNRLKKGMGGRNGHLFLNRRLGKKPKNVAKNDKGGGGKLSYIGLVGGGETTAVF